MKQSALVILSFAARFVFAQQTVPVSSEPRHHFQFENTYIRLYDVVVPPGDTTRYHIHGVDYTYISIGAASLVAQALGAEPTPLLLGDGEVRFTKGPITHRVWNVGTTPFHNLTIELLHRGAGSPTPATRAEGDSLVMENDRVRVTSRLIRAGETVRPVGNHRLYVFLTPGRVAWNGKATEVKPGTHVWAGEDAAAALANIGTNAVTLVIFSVK